MQTIYSAVESNESRRARRIRAACHGIVSVFDVTGQVSNETSVRPFVKGNGIPKYWKAVGRLFSDVSIAELAGVVKVVKQQQVSTFKTPK